MRDEFVPQRVRKKHPRVANAAKHRIPRRGMLFERCNPGRGSPGVSKPTQRAMHVAPQKSVPSDSSPRHAKAESTHYIASSDVAPHAVRGRSARNVVARRILRWLATFGLIGDAFASSLLGSRFAACGLVRESNPRQSGSWPDALPTELTNGLT